MPLPGLLEAAARARHSASDARRDSCAALPEDEPTWKRERGTRAQTSSSGIGACRADALAVCRCVRRPGGEWDEQPAPLCPSLLVGSPETFRAMPGELDSTAVSTCGWVVALPASLLSSVLHFAPSGSTCCCDDGLAKFLVFEPSGLRPPLALLSAAVPASSAPSWCLAAGPAVAGAGLGSTAQPAVATAANDDGSCRTPGPASSTGVSVGSCANGK